VVQEQSILLKIAGLSIEDFGNARIYNFSMKTFQSFLTERRVEEQSMIRDYLKSRNMDGDYKAYRKEKNRVAPPPAEPQGWELKPDEAIHDISSILKSTLQQMPKENRFGIDDVNAKMINKQEVQSGTQLSLELSGVAAARDNEHIIGHLKKLMQYAKPQLAQKGIHVEVLYNQLQQTGQVDEMAQDEPAIGLVHKYKFTVKMVAVVTGMKKPAANEAEVQPDLEI
jgi:hypothetical protein